MKPRLPQELLIATNNKGKFFEIEDLLKQVGVKAVSTFQFDIMEPEETGSTFAENSLLKAKYYAEKTGIFALADDSGICVTALENRPGIHSARYAVDEKTGERNFFMAFEKIFAELKKVDIYPSQKPRAFFVCSLAVFDPTTKFSMTFEGRVDGHLVYPPRGEHGFGYDPIFIKDDMTQTFSEIGTTQKEQISHRAAAFKKLTDWLKSS